MFDHAIELAEVGKDWWCVSSALSGRAMCDWMAGDLAAAASSARAVIDAATKGGSPLELALAGLFLGLAQTWLGDFVTARVALEESLATFRRMRDPLYVGYSLTGLHGLAVHQGRSDDAQNLIAEVMALAQKHPGTNLMAQALFAAAFGEVAWSDPATALELAERAVSAQRDTGMGGGPVATECLHVSGVAARRLGDSSRSRADLDLALRQARSLDSPWTKAGVLVAHAWLLLSEVDLDGAWSDAGDALAISRASGNRLRLLESLDAVSGLACTEGRYEEAAQLHAAADAARVSIGSVRTKGQERDDATTVRQLRDALDREVFERAAEAGSARGIRRRWLVGGWWCGGRVGSSCGGRRAWL